LLEFRRKRLEPSCCRFGEHTTPFAIFEHPRGILESTRQ
jgi:hypothetical protein